MESFISLCKATQPELKEYMEGYLGRRGYNVINEDGFLYAKGTVPVLLVAHMDTVHAKQCKHVTIDSGKISATEGIGGDDRCGVYIIKELVKELHCSVLLCEDEEKGTVGARKFTKTDYINNLDVNFMIEFDRKGNDDAVFYTCDNQEFIKFVTDTTGYKKAFGSYSDISVLMPAAKLSAVNLSSGYYNAHSTNEYVIWDEMCDTIEIAKDLINAECDGPFEYVAKKYEFQRPTASDNYYQFDFYDYLPDSNSAQMELENMDIELEVIIPDELRLEKAVCVSGDTKAECWAKFFLGNPDFSFNDIITYSWQ